MADFCKECSIETFGEDFGDLVGVTPPEANDRKRWRITLCEGCGPIQVDHLGRCISDDCLRKHGLTWKWEMSSQGAS